MKQLATFLSGLNEWYPYDVSMNIIRNSHYPRIHEDCEPSEVLLLVILLKVLRFQSSSRACLNIVNILWRFEISFF